MGKWEEAPVIREEIKVRGARAPVIEEVRITRHGPILTSMQRPSSDGQAGKNGATADSGELPLALRWTGLEKHHVIAAAQKIIRAPTSEEFRETLREWNTPPQNIVHADLHANIAYVMAGALPP